MGPDTYWLSAPYIKLQKANHRVHCLPLYISPALTRSLSSFIPPLRPSSLGRFAIKTAVTQSETVKLKLPPSLARLSALPRFLLCPRCVEFITGRTWKRGAGGWNHKTTLRAWNTGVMQRAQFKCVTFCQTKCRHSENTCRSPTIIFLFPAVSVPLFLGWSKWTPHCSGTEQLRGRQDNGPQAEKRLLVDETGQVWSRI